MQAAFGEYHIILANETQNNVHYAMPVRNMLYDVLEYVRQIQDLEKAHKENGDKLERDAFLSGITKDDRLKPVITTVFYLGDRWDGSKSLYELLNIEEMDENIQCLKEYLPNYRIHLVSAHNIDQPNNFKTCLHHIFNMLKLNKNKKQLYQYIKKNKNALAKMDAVETRATLVLLGEQKRVSQLLQKNPTREGISVCQAIDELIQDGKEEGRNEGAEQKLVQLVCKKLKRNKSFETIVDETEEEEKIIQPIYETALSFAPQFEWLKVYEAMQKRS